jgi:hypothetical protein
MNTKPPGGEKGNYAAVAITPDGFVKSFVLFFVFFSPLTENKQLTMHPEGNFIRCNNSRQPVSAMMIIITRRTILELNSLFGHALT